MIFNLMHVHYVLFQLVNRVKTLLFFGMDKSFSVLANKRKKDILTLGEAPWIR